MPSRLLYGSGAEPRVLFVCNCAGILQPFEFLDLIGHAVADHLTKIVARLLSPLALPLSHPAVLRDQINKNPEIREDDQCDHPNRLGPAGYVVTAEQVAEYRDQQPEPQHENEYR